MGVGTSDGDVLDEEDERKKVFEDERKTTRTLTERTTARRNGKF